MEVLSFLIILTIFILILVFNSQTSTKLEQTIKHFNELRQEFIKQILLSDRRHKELIDKIAQLEQIQKTISDKKPKTEVEPPIEKVEPIQEPVKEIIKQEIESETKPESEAIKTDETKIEPIQPVQPLISQPVQPEIKVEQKQVTQLQQPVYQQKVQIPSTPKKKVNYEKLIGEKLLPFIAIGILVIGLAFFVKYAIDKDWINEIGRVAIGIVSGGILIGIAHKLRTNYRTFSSILAGGGLAALYFSIAFGFQMYHLFSQTAAFAIMVVITGFAIVLSLAYDKKELAILAIIGGFATPLMVSTGEGNYKILFTYLAILNIGMLVLAYFKKWNIINIITYIFTICFYGAWLVGGVLMLEFNPPYEGALIFATIFYVIFFFMNIINNIKIGEKFKAIEIIILITNSFLYYTAGMLVIHELDAQMKGLFTTFLAVFNFGFAYMLYKRKQVDKNLVYSLIALVLTFLSLAAPVQLDGNNITLFWAVEAVALLWLSQKSGLKIIKLGSAIVIVLMFISLLIDWNNIYLNPSYDAAPLRVLLNRGFITSIVSVSAMVAYILLLKKDKDVTILNKVNIQTFNNFLITFVIIALYITCLLELGYQIQIYVPYSAARNSIIGTYTMLFILGVMLWSKKQNVKYVFQIITVIAIIMLVVYLTFYNYQYIKVRNGYLTGEILNRYSIIHYIGVIAVISISYFVWRFMQIIAGERSVLSRLTLWFSIFTLVFVFSSELDTIVLYLNYKEGYNIYSILESSHKIGFPILWGLFAFVLMVLGMKYKNYDFRIISISLFAITLFKLFLFDLQDISDAGKIAAFISLGILLLVLGFMYQKLKKILFDDDNDVESKKID